MQSTLADLGRVLLAVLLAAAGLWTSWCVAVRLLDRARAAERACAAAVVWLWLSTALFAALSGIGAFTLPLTLTAWCAAAVGAQLFTRSYDPGRALVEALADLRQLLVLLAQRPAAPLFGAAALVLAAHLLRGIMAPSLAWDDLTYHLFRAARWTQAGGFTVQNAPNAWGYSEYFPPTGDIVWAWAMLPVRSDSLLVFANLFVYCTIGLAVYAGARLVQGDQTRAALAACAVVLIPSVIHYLPSGYVDPLTIALFAATIVFCHRAIAQRSPVDLVLMAAALGLAAGVKISNLAFAIPGMVVILLVLLRAGIPVRQRTALVSACLGAALVSAPFFVKAWADTGSPSYPVPVEIAGVTIFTGNFWQQEIFAGAQDGTDDSSGHLFGELFIPTREAFHKDGQFINLGPGALLLGIGALGGALSGFRNRKFRGAWAYVLFAAVLVTLSALQPGVVNLRATVLGTSFGRFLGVPVVAAAIWASSARGPFGRTMLPIAVGVNCLLAIPLGWSATDLGALRALAGWALPIMAVGVVAVVLLFRAGFQLAGAVTGALALATCLAVLSPVRSALRYDYYRDAAGGKAFTVNRDVEMIARAWPMWRRLDQDRPLQLAVAAGWPGMSPIGPRYPLLGSRLQNRVSYVPITGDGTVADNPGSFARVEQGDYNVWLGRLVAGRFDYLVVLTPAIEGMWARTHADVFQPEDVGDFELYRIDHARASAYLRPGS